MQNSKNIHLISCYEHNIHVIGLSQQPAHIKSWNVAVILFEKKGMPGTSLWDSNIICFKI
jgi:hypothetical protein